MARNRSYPLSQIAIISTFLLLTGCHSLLRTEKQIKVVAPTFKGSEVYTAVIPKSHFVLLGNCDDKSTGLEYSFDEKNWSTLAPDCASGRFSLHLVVRDLVNVFIRAKTPEGYTGVARATIQHTSDKKLSPSMAEMYKPARASGLAYEPSFRDDSHQIPQ